MPDVFSVFTIKLFDSKVGSAPAVQLGSKSAAHPLSLGLIYITAGGDSHHPLHGIEKTARYNIRRFFSYSR
jgi:hypothetical protein